MIKTTRDPVPIRLLSAWQIAGTVGKFQLSSAQFEHNLENE
jgi:hypothetical protein